MAHAVGLPSSSEQVWRELGHDPAAYHPLALEHFLLEAPYGPTVYDEEKRAAASAYADAEERPATALARSPVPGATRPVLFDLAGLWDFQGVFIAAQSDAGLPTDFLPRRMGKRQGVGPHASTGCVLRCWRVVTKIR